jgi:signal recognition particle receptor subunit beta
MQQAMMGRTMNQTSARTANILAREQVAQQFPDADAGMDNFRNKLVFVSNMGASKAMAIHAISDVAPVSTSMPRSIDHATAKFTLDYTTARLDDGELLHVYGVPGQKHLDFMWPVVCDDATGILILVNARDPQRLAYTTMMLDEFTHMAPDASFVVGVTRSDLAPGFRLDEFRSALIAEGFRLPVVKVDVRVPAQVRFLVKILLSSRLAGSPSAAT